MKDQRTQSEKLQEWKEMMRATGFNKMPPGRMMDALEDPTKLAKLTEIRDKTDISPFFRS